jgi:hypothetical protein
MMKKISLVLVFIVAFLFCGCISFSAKSVAKSIQKKNEELMKDFETKESNAEELLIIKGAWRRATPFGVNIFVFEDDDNFQLIESIVGNNFIPSTNEGVYKIKDGKLSVLCPWLGNVLISYDMTFSDDNSVFYQGPYYGELMESFNKIVNYNPEQVSKYLVLDKDEGNNAYITFTHSFEQLSLLKGSKGWLKHITFISMDDVKILPTREIVLWYRVPTGYHTINYRFNISYSTDRDALKQISDSFSDMAGVKSLNYNNIEGSINFNFERGRSYNFIIDFDDRSILNIEYGLPITHSPTIVLNKNSL